MRGVVLMLLMVLATFASGAPAPFAKRERRAKSDLDLLQGRWQLVANNGKEQMTLLVGGDRMTFISGEGKDIVEIAFALNPGMTPKHIDFTIVHSTDGPGQRGKKYLSIYRLSGDMLTLGLGDRGERPSDFNLKEWDILAFKRLPR